jgi:class 3 adenylate cyclase
MTSTLFAVGGAIVVLVLAALVRRGRREATLLRRRLADATNELERLQHAFSRFAPDEVIERIIAEGSADKGEKREVTVLFADLVGFTALSERTEPSTLVRIMNGYFERMSGAISANRGYVSTFIGDGILAFFGATDPNPWQGNDAVRAALGMRAALADYNRELAAEGLAPLAIGMGLHRGVGVVGLVGSRDLKEFAFVGRTVNVAARAQELTRTFKTDVILTESLRRTIDPNFALKVLPDTLVKGVAEPLAIYALATVADTAGGQIGGA